MEKHGYLQRRFGKQGRQANGILLSIDVDYHASLAAFRRSVDGIARPHTVLRSDITLTILPGPAISTSFLNISMDHNL